MRHSLHTRKWHKLHSAPRLMYPKTRQHRAHADFESIIGLSNEPPTLIAPFRRNNCKSDRNALLFAHSQSGNSNPSECVCTCEAEEIHTKRKDK